MKHLKSILFSFFLFVAYSFAQPGPPICSLEGSPQNGYVLTIVTGSICQWKSPGASSVNATTLKNAWFLTADSGTANTVVGSTSTTFPMSYSKGQVIIFNANATNTGATTINVSGDGVVNLTKNGNNALVAGNKVIGVPYIAEFDGTEFVLMNFTIVATDIPITNQNTTGQAGTALALTSSPMGCAAGFAAGGIQTNGNSNPCVPIIQKFFGTGIPGSISGNLPGDEFYDYTDHINYYCGAAPSTVAPACTSVSLGGWTLSSGTGSGSTLGVAPISFATGTMTFPSASTGCSGSTCNVYTLTLTGNVTASSPSTNPAGMTAGIYIVLITGASNYTIGNGAGPSNFVDFPTTNVPLTPGTTLIYTCIWNPNTNLCNPIAANDTAIYGSPYPVSYANLTSAGVNICPANAPITAWIKDSPVNNVGTSITTGGGSNLVYATCFTPSGHWVVSISTSTSGGSSSGVSYIYFRSIVNNTISGSNFSVPSNCPGGGTACVPTSISVEGSSSGDVTTLTSASMFGTMSFAANSAANQANSVQGMFPLASTWVSSAGVTLQVTWRTSATTGNALWQIQGQCVASGALPGSFSTAVPLSTSTAAGTTEEWTQTAVLTMTTSNALSGCSPGNIFMFRLFRDHQNSSDTVTTPEELALATFGVTQ